MGFRSVVRFYFSVRVKFGEFTQIIAPTFDVMGISLFAESELKWRKFFFRHFVKMIVGITVSGDKRSDFLRKVVVALLRKWYQFIIRCFDYVIVWHFINRSCCLRNNGNCPVSPNIARSELLWRTRKTSLRYFSWIRSRFSTGFSWKQISQAYSIMGRTCWLNISKCSDVASSFPTALWTHVLVVISSTQVSDSHLSPPGALQSRRASLQWT